jgi:membrane fusion protein, multidrug efflux system
MLKQVKIRRSIVLGIVLIGITALVFKLISSKDEKVENKTSFRTLKVKTKIAKNGDRSLQIDLSGKLVANNRIDMFSEVSGVLRSNNFREGTAYRKGQILAQIDGTELRATIKSQKSTLLNNIAQILPDMAIDFPLEVRKWREFHKAVDFDKPLPLLPEFEDEKFKMFVSSKNVFSSYFSIKAQEIRLSKHTMAAPFSGVLSATDIDPGTLVRAGQKMGTFIQPNQFELEASISLDDLKFIKVGSSVKLQSSELGKSWQGKLLRINEQLDPSTQSVKVYIGVNDVDLKEGQYLTAQVQGSELNDVVEVARNLLLGDDEIYFIENDSVLSRKAIDVVYKGKEWMYIKGIPDGAQLLNQAVTSAHDGMIVSIMSKKDS